MTRNFAPTMHKTLLTLLTNVFLVFNGNGFLAGEFNNIILDMVGMVRNLLGLYLQGIYCLHAVTLLLYE